MRCNKEIRGCGAVKNSPFFFCYGFRKSSAFRVGMAVAVGNGVGNSVGDGNFVGDGIKVIVQQSMAKCPRFSALNPKIGQNHEICPIYKKHMENQNIQQYNVTRGPIGLRILRMKN